MNKTANGKRKAKKLIVFSGIVLAAALLVMMPFGAFAEGASSSEAIASATSASQGADASSNSISSSVLAVSEAESQAASSTTGESGSTPASSVPDSSSMPEEEEEEIPERLANPNLPFMPFGLGISPMSTGLVLEGGKTPEQLIGKLLGEGIAVSNVSFVGNATAAGFFSGGDGILAEPGYTGTFDEGIVLSSGNIASLAGPNTSGSTGTSFNLPGDADLAALVGQPVTSLHDAVVLEFDFVPQGNYLQFQYVFG